ncbi:MAG TPA: indolepyruvate ferredoxin oxidoreductase subunit alpha [Chloroflexi bacterium]|nr:indolepyruvate ferredoxin oxidoreductase subunit alpha [Chloroflexota bacterium]
MTDTVQRLLSGNEAIARGAWEAGVAVASGYPGTPSTEILENFARMPGVYAEWAPNEKVALDVAIGAAYAGRRALATMKHVGLNVAADAFFYVAMTGMEAGLVIVSADDPSMHSSQNEQDNRRYAKFARIPCLDPADSQEAKDMTAAAFDLSERFDVPVLLRPTTRICHTSTLVELGPDRKRLPEPGKYPRNPAKYVMVPANARKRHPVIEHRLQEMAAYAETFPFNRIEWRDRSLGIITNGVAYQYAREVFPEASVLKLGMSYPLPYGMIREFSDGVEKLIVLEELDPFIEEEVRLMGIPLYTPPGEEDTYRPNRKTIFPIIGELNPRIVREAARKAGLLEGAPAPPENGSHPKGSTAPDSLPIAAPILTPQDLPSRPPVLCPGCPHRSTFYILHKLKRPVNGDIGCYTLGVIPPLSAIHTTGCMGASIGVAHGGAVAGDKERHIAVIGDSTFFHTGIPALLNVAYNNSNVITVIMDNRITGMTGHQDNPGTGRTLQGRETREVDIEALVRACGIETVKTVEAYHVEEIEKTLKTWLKQDGPAVLIVEHACVLLPEERKEYLPLRVEADACNGCGICFRVGCPAIVKSEQVDPKYGRPLAEIDPLLCTGCEICAQVCPRDAILFRDQILEEQRQAHGKGAKQA